MAARAHLRVEIAYRAELVIAKRALAAHASFARRAVARATHVQRWRAVLSDARGAACSAAAHLRAPRPVLILPVHLTTRHSMQALAAKQRAARVASDVVGTPGLPSVEIVVVAKAAMHYCAAAATPFRRQVSNASARRTFVNVDLP